jgi:hypothetical protein
MFDPQFSYANGPCGLRMALGALYEYNRASINKYDIFIGMCMYICIDEITIRLLFRESFMSAVVFKLLI